MIRRCLPAAAELAEEELIAAYAVADRSVPSLRVNMVSSLDGAVTVDGLSGGLSSEDDQNMLGRLRMLADAVLVGAGTVRAEGYGALRLRRARREWRTGNGLPEHVVLVIVSARLELTPGMLPFEKAPVRPVIITCASSPAEQRDKLAEVADVLVFGADQVDLPAAIQALSDRGLRQLICEGGPHLLGSLTAADLVDELCLTMSPLLAGPGASRITSGLAPSMARRLRPIHYLLSDDGFLFTRYTRHHHP